jgi:hypothetical protein
MTSFMDILSCFNSLFGCSWMAPLMPVVIVMRGLTGHPNVLSACMSGLYIVPFLLWVVLETLVCIKNGHSKKDMCYNDIGLCVQNIGVIMGSMLHIIGRGLWDHLKTKGNLRFDLLLILHVNSLVENMK